LLNSKAELSSFGLELSKKMGMRYVAPPMPVNLTMNEGSPLPTLPDGVGHRERADEASQGFGSFDLHALNAMFEKK
jgi:hypothetical protein